ncbi:hypothetical protein L9F63_014463, partial [Diploptera punctata]
MQLLMSCKYMFRKCWCFHYLASGTRKLDLCYKIKCFICALRFNGCSSHQAGPTVTQHRSLRSLEEEAYILSFKFLPSHQAIANNQHCSKTDRRPARQQPATTGPGPLKPQTTNGTIKIFLAKKGIKENVTCEELPTKGSTKAFKSGIPFNILEKTTERNSPNETQNELRLRTLNWNIEGLITILSL